MNLVLYSDQIIPENRRVDEVLVSMLPLQPHIGYIPSAVEPRREWFESRRIYYAQIDLQLQIFHDPILDAIFSNSDPDLVTPNDGLSLVEFEFFPHLYADPSYLPRLLEYSRARERSILACPDGSGVVVNNDGLHMIGDGLHINRGYAKDWRDN